METLVTWKNQGSNDVLDFGNFFISYLRNEKYLPTSFRPDTEEGETAIVIRRADGDSTFHILNGDFRKEYSELAPKGLDACMKFFNDNLDKKSSWSD